MKYKPRADEKSIYELYHEYCQDQKEFISIELEKGNFNEAIRLFEDYLLTKKNQVIVLQSKENLEYLFLQYETRFSPSYRRKIRKKFEKTLNCNSNIGHLTLTFQNLSFSELILKKKDISKAFNTFIKKLSQLMNVKLRYVATKEITQTSDLKLHLHYHVIFFDFRFISYKVLQALKKLWINSCETNNLKARYVFYKFVKGQNALFYALKYVQKEFLQVNLTSIILHLLKLRSYTTSEKINKDLQAPELSRYVFLGSYTIQEAKNQFRYNPEPQTTPQTTPPPETVPPLKTFEIETIYINR